MNIPSLSSGQWFSQQAVSGLQSDGADFFLAPSVNEVDLSGYAGQVGDEIVVRAHTHTRPKPLRSVAGQPILGQRNCRAYEG